MPFVTEEIYQKLPIKEEKSIMTTNYPKYDKNLNFDKEEEIVDDQVEFIKSFRNIKAENNITKDMKVMFDTKDNNDIIVKLLRLDEHLIDRPLGIKAYKVFSNRVKARIFYEKIETKEELENKKAQIKTLEASIKRRENLLSNENYVNKAPANIVEMDRKKLEEEKQKLKELTN